MYIYYFKKFNMGVTFTEAPDPTSGAPLGVPNSKVISTKEMEMMNDDTIHSTIVNASGSSPTFFFLF
jgi:hypothetical protein